MPNPKIYNDALETFLAEYPIDKYNLNNLAEFDKKFKFVNNFLSTSTVGDAPASQFISWASRTMSAYLADQIQIGTTDLSKFSAQNFLEAFEALAAAKYESELEEGQESTRDQYAGADKKDIKKAFIKTLSAYNKPLPTILKDNLKAGVTSIEAMQSMTDGAYNFLENGQDNKEAMGEELSQVVAALETMRQIRESRKGIIGWFWKLFHGDQNTQEEAYYERLKEQVQKVKDMNYDVDKATENVTGKTVFGKALKTKEQEKTAEHKAAESSETSVSNNEKEKVFSEGHPFVESNVDKSSPVAQQPTHDAPTIQQNK